MSPQKTMWAPLIVFRPMDKFELINLINEKMYSMFLLLKGLDFFENDIFLSHKIFLKNHDDYHEIKMLSLNIQLCFSISVSMATWLLSKDLLKGTSLAPHRMIAPRYSCYSI